MNIYEELQERGLIAQVTDEKKIRELINNGGARFYIGFDPTADSLSRVGYQLMEKICTILYLINLFSNVIVCKV